MKYRTKFGFSILRNLPNNSVNMELNGFKRRDITQKIRLEESTVLAITEFIHQNQLCMPSLLTTVWAVLKSHYLANNEVSVLYSSIPKIKKNVLIQCDPLLIQIQNEDNFYDLVHKVKTQMDHGKREGSKIETSTQVEVSPMSSTVSSECSISEIVKIQWSPIANSSSCEKNQPLITILHEYRPGELEYTVQYDKRYLDKIPMYTIAEQFLVLLKGILSRLEKPALSHPFLTTSEEKQFIRWNDTDSVYSKSKTVHQFVEEQVVRTPEAVAIEFREKKLSYLELNRRANQIARIIKDVYRTNGQFEQLHTMPITIVMDRSENVIPVMLGVMKTGAAYLPVDPAYPKERIRFILEDAKTKVILTTRQLATMLEPIVRQSGLEEPQLICIDECLTQYGGSDENLNVEVEPSDLAYIIYTSGSTGKPKGALIEHAGLVALIPYIVDKFDLTPNTRVMQFASISFDASVYEWIGTLSIGGTLVVLSEEDLPPYEDISNIIERKNIHVAMLPPSIIKTMTKRDLPGLRTIVSAGEACTPDLVMDWGGGDRLFLNAYGPTEVTIICSVAICKPGKNITIGRPVSNKRLYVLNPYGNPVPIGVPGELWVGGVGLARGYLNREELTKERFVHKEIMVGEGYTRRIERLYKTGDIVKWTSDGELIFLGRNDDQVKIRGYRIELGEIENQIRNHPGIIQCMVKAWYDGHYQKLAAYYTSSMELEESTLIQHLTTVLPSFMMPSYFFRLEVFPLNVNGKIDRSALPHPIGMENHAFEEMAIAGEAEMEKQLLDVWRQLLKRQNIGVHDHFYAVGGDSILAIQSVSMARDRGIVFTPRQLADNPSVKELASIAVWQDDNEPKVKEFDWEGEFGLTPIQNWFFEQRFQEPNYFNQSHMLVLNHCDSTRLESALNRLIQIHPELSLQFVSSGNTYIQRYRTDVSAVVASYTIRETEDPDPEITAICSKWNEELNYESGTMLIAGVIDGHLDGKIRLFLSVHHLVIDGVSWRILLQDLYQLYHGSEPKPVQSPFKQWQDAITDYVSKEGTARHVPYWVDVLKRAEAFQLPVDHCTDDRNCTETAEIITTLQTSDTQRLIHQCAHAYHTQINDLLLTAWSLMLSDWSGQELVAFRLEGHGREHCVSDMDLTRTIGWFTSMFPVCIQVPSERSLGKTIKSVKEQLRSIPDHGVSYGVLRYCDSSEHVRASLTASDPQALFNYLGQFDFTEMKGEAESEWLNFTSDTAQDNSSSKNHGTSLLELNCSIVQGRLHLFMKYSKRHYEEATIARLIESFISNLLSVIEDCEGKEVQEFTPSDFPLASLKQHSLDMIVNRYHSKYGLYQVLPLSPMQKGLLFHYLDHVSSDQYVVQMSWKYNGRLDVGRYQEAWQRVITENDSLRTCFVWEGLDEPVQCVIKKPNLNWIVEDICSQTLDLQEYLGRWMTLDRERRFDLRQPAYRLALIQYGPEEWTVVWSYHHILLDGWSLPLLLNRVHDVYDSSIKAVSPKRNTSLSFELYIRWLISKNRTEAEGFWKTYLANVIEPTPLPMDISRKSFEVHQPIRKQQIETLQLDLDFTRRIATFVRQTQISLNTLIQFAWGKVLQVLNDADVTVFGMVVSGRGSDLPKTDLITGLMINTLPLIMRWNTDQSVTSYLKDLHYTIQKLNDYCYVSLTELKSWSSVQSPSLFQSIVAFENYVNDYRQPTCGLNMSAMEEREKTNYPITITIVADQEQITIKLMYDAERFEKETISRLTAHLHRALHVALEQPDCAVRDIDLISQDDYERIIYDWNRTFTEYPRESSIVELFEEQVQLLSSQPAVITYGKILTYETLSRLSAYVAGLLEKEGLVNGKFVGVYMPRSLEFIVSILGILKSGCAYVPIDPDFPPQRTLDLIEDAELDTIITLPREADSLTEAVQGKRLKLIIADDFEGMPSMEQKERGSKPAVASDLAYLMYTSGSTGRPKGVMIEHRNIVRLVKNTNYFTFSQDIRILYTGSPVFDASTFEIWGALLNGGRLFVVSKDELMNLTLLKQQMQAWDINTLWLSAALCNHWIEENITMFSGLRSLIVGGEVLSTKLINRLHLAYPSLKILNAYGPTENTTFSTSFLIDRPFLRNIPIGKPISNTTCYILNARRGVLPVDAVGEIYVGGDGVARGYWKRDKLTREAFIPNPFASAEDRDKGRNLMLYRTGDRGRWLTDGNIEYIGRSDGQLKLRGIRIELGEIEQRLSNFPEVKQSLVLAREVHGEMRVIAYYTSNKEEQAELEERLSDYMAKYLPSYMLPFRYILLESFPLTVNGKVDKKILPIPQVKQTKEDFESGTLTELEKQIEQIWCHVLKIDYIRKDEDFHALGGHSLHALRMVSMLQKVGYSVTVNQILREQTIERLASSLNETILDLPQLLAIPSAKDITLSGRDTYPHNGFPLSAVQRRFFKRNLKNRNMFNVPYLSVLKKSTTIHELNRALQLLIKRHPALRLTFAQLDNGEWYQYERELNMLQVTYVDLRKQATPHDTFISEYCSNLQQGFNIETGPLWKVVLFDNYFDSKQVLLLLFHHSIFDGMSMNIILDDLKQILILNLREDDAQIDKIGSSYRDWCEALTRYASNGIDSKTETYWRSVVEGGKSLETDRDAEEWPSHRHMETITFNLLEDTLQVKKLKAFAATKQMSPLGVILAVLSQTCFDLKKQSDLLLHLMSYQRESFLPNIVIERTIGFFAGAYPVRINIGKQDLADNTEALLDHIKTMMQRIPNEGMDYFALRYIVPEIQPEAEPFTDGSRMLFHYQSEETGWKADDFYEPLAIPYGNTSAPDNPSAYWLNMTAILKHDRLSLTCYYSTLHYEKETVVRLVNLFAIYLRECIEGNAYKTIKEGNFSYENL